MSASDNLSQELFFTAHRGLDVHPVKGLGLGTHWSARKEVAEEFALPRDMHSGDGQYYPTGHPPQTVITAKIPMSSVETDTKKLIERQVLDREAKVDFPEEDEIPVKPGATVHVESIKMDSPRTITAKKAREAKTDEEAWKHERRLDKRNRTRTKRFNPPKEMQA